MVSESSCNYFLLIASIIIFQLILGSQKRTHLSLMRSMTERQFLLFVPQRSTLFTTELSTVIRCQPILWWLILLYFSIILKKLGKERIITGIIEVTVMRGFLIERYTSREPFGFVMAVLGSTKIPTTVNKLAMADLQRILTPSFMTVDMFPYFLHFDLFLTMMNFWAISLLK